MPPPAPSAGVQWTVRPSSSTESERLSRNSRARRQTPRRTPKVLLAIQSQQATQRTAQRVKATVKRYARLDEEGNPIRCVGFQIGAKIVFDTAQAAEACRQSLVSRGLSEARSVHECRRRAGETHFHLTRRVPQPERD